MVPRGGGNPGGSGDFSQEPRFHGTQQGGVTHGPAASWGPSVRAAPEPPPATSTVGTCSLWDPSGGTAATQMSPNVPRCPQMSPGAGWALLTAIYLGWHLHGFEPLRVPSPRCPFPEVSPGSHLAGAEHHRGAGPAAPCPRITQPSACRGGRQKPYYSLPGRSAQRITQPLHQMGLFFAHQPGGAARRRRRVPGG